MTKEKYFLIILLAVLCFSSAMFVSKFFNDNNDTETYAKAIELYQADDYGKAYYQFSQITGSSKLKPAALFRQARCAIGVGDTDTAIKNYTTFIKRYPDSPLRPIAEYNLAIILYERGTKKECHQAEKHFNILLKKYPDSEVAIASYYYLGLINNDTKLLIKYLELSPTGRYTQDAVKYIEKTNTKLSNLENLIIANSFLKREQYKEALEYYKQTSLVNSWCGFAKTQFKLGNINDAKSITVKGLKEYSSLTETKEMYDVIDCFVATSDSKPMTIKYLLSVNNHSKANDYMLYLLAQYLTPSQAQDIYKTIYKKFPNGQFTADALYMMFYYQILQHKYDEAKRLGQIHLSRFGNTNSAPAVMYWMGKIAEKRYQDSARSYYKGVISKYPDSYYAFRANAQLSGNYSFEKTLLNPKPIIVPIKNKAEAEIVQKLVDLKDYDLVTELYKNDGFVQSWIEYKKGNYTHSAILARDAMDELTVKPDFKDVRWRLVYPIHYYNFIKKYNVNKNSIIILSILKEESHFNQNIKSSVGACGLMQLMPATADEIARENGLSNNLFNPENNIHLGSLYYTKIKHYMDNKDISAIMAYNGGWGSVKTWKSTLNYSDTDDFIEQIPYPETKDYVKKVLKSYWCYSNIY